MAFYLSPLWGAGAQLFDLQGVILAGGKIKTYLAGTTTPAATYTDSTGSVSNGTVIILDSSGRPPDEIWLTGGQAYKFQLTDLNDVQIGDLFDNITGVNDPGGGAGGTSVWTTFSGTPSYISSTQFSLTGDQRATFPDGTRVKATVTAGTAYGTVSAASYSSFTTVTIIPDGTALDSGLSAVAVSINAVAGANVSAAAVDYKAGVVYPAGTIGAAIQSQSLATVTTGTSTAYVLTPSTPITSYVFGQSFLVEFNQASGSNPTINISGKGPKNLMQYNSAGAKVAATLYASQISYVVYDGTDMVVVNPAPAASATPTHYSIAVSDGSASSRTVFLSAGTWQLSLFTSGSDNDSLGNSNISVSQTATVVTIGSATTSFTLSRTGGSGFGRVVGNSDTAVASLTVSTAGNYTFQIAAASVTGTSTGNYTASGSMAHLEKTA